MRRLREQTESADPAMARAAALLSAVAPLDADRIRRRPLPPVETATRRKAPALRAALVLAMTFGTVAAAATTLQRTAWWTPPVASRSSLARPTLVAPLDKDRRAAPPLGNPAAAASAADEAIAPVVAPPSAGPGLAVRTAAMAHASPAGLSRAPASRGSDGESALMVDAVRALRRDGDPAKALSLSEQALQRYPRGAQVEEALAIGMEAASTSGDAVTARRLAERYLESFRAGRFADRATRIVSALPK